jgi:hypothetical protein
MSRVFSLPAILLDALVRAVILPVVAVIPFLVRTGLLFGVFALLWATLLVSLALQPAALGVVWGWVGALPLPAQALLWLLFLPLTAGLWAWHADWPLAVRVLLVLSLAGWNLLVFLPRRDVDPAGRRDAIASVPTVS